MCGKSRAGSNGRAQQQRRRFTVVQIGRVEISRVIKMESASLDTRNDTDRKRRIHIFVLIDALGWEFLKNKEFLSGILPYRRPLRTVLGFSSGAIPTIL